MSDVINTAKNHGFTLIEVLVAMAISAVGLLGFLSLHTHMVAADTEISRQAKAAALVQYMSAQVQAYPTLGSYCGSSLKVPGSSFNCDLNPTDVPQQNSSAMTKSALDTWKNLINQSALPDAQGCITYTADQDKYTVSIDWSGSLSSLPDADSLTCDIIGSGNRTLSYTVVVSEAL